MTLMTPPNYREIYDSKEEYDYAANLPGEDDLDPKLLAAEYKQLVAMGHTPSEAASIIDTALDLEPTVHNGNGKRMNAKTAIKLVKLGANSTGRIWVKFNLPLPFFRLAFGPACRWGPWWGIN